ncbi:MAG: class B sortase [Ruthenibacterium sp.]
MRRKTGCPKDGGPFFDAGNVEDEEARKMGEHPCRLPRQLRRFFRSHRKKISLAALCVLAAVLIGFDLYALWPRPAAVAESKTMELLRQAKAANADTVAWLTVPGTEIDASVLQAKDNEYYLRRNEKREKDIWGCYFMDYECHAKSVAALDFVTILYGNSLDDSADAARFSQIKRYRDASFAQKNACFSLSLLSGETVKCRVLAASAVPATLEYLDPNPSPEKRASMLATIRAASEQLFSDVNVSDADKIIILSTGTADEDMRFVVVAKIETA